MKTMTTTTTTTWPSLRLRMGTALLAAAFVAAGGLAGCDKKSEPAKTNVPKPPAPDVTPKATAGAASNGTGSGAGAKTTSAGAPTTQASSSSATKPSGAPIVDAPLVTSTETAKHSKEAQDLLGKAMQALKDSKFDECKASLDKVDAMGNDVPKATREQATTVRKSLDAAQKLQKAPELPAGEGPNK